MLIKPIRINGPLTGTDINIYDENPISKEYSPTKRKSKSCIVNFGEENTSQIPRSIGANVHHWENEGQPDYDSASISNI